GEHLELKLFGEASTSVSMASATGLLDQATARWDPEALAAAEIDEARLFPLRDWTEARRGLRAPWAMRWPALRGVDWLPAVGDGVTVLPHWAGERAPGWRGDRVGVIAGLRLDTTALEITRAALEAVALRLALVYDLLAPCAAPAHTIVASGGALARSRVWTQITADALGQPIRWSPTSEATSR